MSKKKVNKFLLIGWDAAEWKVMEPMMEQGLMPTLKKFLSEATSGRIATLDPPFSPMLWTSIATGKRAYDHGIMGFIEPTPNGDALRPVMSTSRKVKALWNILNQSGYRSNVIGWWPSHPAEPINGVMVSNFYQNFKEKMDKPWPMPEGCVHPKEMTKDFMRMRVHADELSTSIISNFIPRIDEILKKQIPINEDEKAPELDRKKAASHLARISGVSKNIATCTSIHSAGTHVIRNTEWDFTAVYYDTIDHFSHIGMKFHPPKQKGLDDDTYEYFKDVVTAGYRFHDMMLERILNLIDEDTTVMILSDHGFHPDNLRPRVLPMEPASPALEHSPYGMLAIKGPGIKKGEKIYGASLLDITPTILHLFGLPVAEDMEGKVLQQIFEQEAMDKVEMIPTWETVPGEDGRHKESDQTNTWASQEAMQQLIDLGYIEKPNEDTAKAVEEAIAEAKYYLARNYINGNKYGEALKLLEEIVAQKPEVMRYSLRLANTYLQTKKFLKAKEIIKQIKTVENYPKYKLALLEGLLCIYTFKIRKAIKILDGLKDQSQSPNLYLQLGRANNIRYRWDESEVNFKKAIELDPYNNIAFHGLGVSYLRRKKYEEAIESFLNAIEINNDMPQAHYNMGEALFKIELYDQAINAFNMALYFQPKMGRAHFFLGEIYKLLGQQEKADSHYAKADEMMHGDRIIVTGLQRSGTSLMMQLLEAAGCEILKDDVKPADEFNPKGYYEYQPANHILKNKGWLAEANGKVVKMYAQGITELPKRFSYKVIWMDRPMPEIIDSYYKASGKKSKGFDAKLSATLTEQVDKAQTWLDEMPNAEIMIVNYSDLLEDPAGEIEEVLAFLEMKKEGMQTSIDFSKILIDSKV